MTPVRIVSVFLKLSAIIHTVSSILIVREEQIKFFLYTSQHPSMPICIKRGELQGIQLDQKPFKVIIHGFDHNAHSYWIRPMKDAYFSKGFTNVLVVDWSAYNLLSGTEYFLSVILVKGVGNYIGDLIKDISETLGVPYEDFHLVGHSLGAQTAGFAGKRIFELTNQKVNRISGLDPAGCCVINSPFTTDNHLSQDDATFMDTIHTSTELEDIYQYPIGPVDFYPNGGITQPGCNQTDKQEQMNCSHNRVLDLFIESILNSGLKFEAKECVNFEQYVDGVCDENKRNRMGEYVDATKTGVFWLETHSEAPYACGETC